MRARSLVISWSLLLLASCGAAEGGGDAGGVLLAGAVFIAAPLVAFFRLRDRWEKLPAASKQKPSAKAGRDGATTRLRRAWVGLLERALRVAGERYKTNVILASALAETVDAIRMFAGPTERLAIAGANDGQLHSWLGVARNRAIYVLIFPGKHDQPSVFRAHAGLSAGWLRHLEALRAQLAAESHVESVLALILLVPADARKGELLVSFDDGHVRVAPSVMLDAQEIATSEWTILRDHIWLDFEEAEAS